MITKAHSGAALARWLRLRRLATTAAVALVGSVIALPLQHAAAFDAPQTQIVSADPYNKTPNVMDEPGSVRYFAQSGNTMIAGGNFTQVESWGTTTPLTRNNIFSFDMTSGQVNPSFAPNLDGMVRTLVMDPNGTEVFVGGEFNNVNGVKYVSLVKLRLADGSIDTTFKPQTMNGRVFTLRYAGGFLYVGGSFTALGPTAEKGLTRLNPTTGAVDPTFNVSFTGTHHGGTTLVEKMDISPDGTRLAAIGNFIAVNGLDRDQVALIDLTGVTPTVANWETDRFKTQCSASFNSYIHDVEYSPDGSYFVIVATGAYVSGSACDAASRWESGASGSALQPTWINYTGGDTFWSVAVTSTAVYVGGHNRWVDNPFAGDKPGAGAVYVSGLAALDPSTGVAFDWYPTRTTGVGVFDLYANDSGLWVGHDTDYIGHEFHYKLAEFPLAGGTTVPRPATGTLPSTVYQLGASGSALGSPVLYRVNAGGPQVQATDGGPNWAADTSATPSPFLSGDTATESWPTITTVNSSVPSSTPKAVFSTDRTEVSGNPEMGWSFPVAAGTPVEVRLYFANQDQNTKSAAQRQFDVTIDGHVMTWGQRTTPYDIVKDVGNKTAVMKYFDTSSDGSVDIGFLQHISHPIVSAIEIVSICGTGFTATTPNDTVTGRSFDGATAGLATPVATTGRSWSQVRGAFMLSGTLYTGWADGHICAAPFDGTSFGTFQPLVMNNAGTNNQFVAEIPTISAMFFSNNHIYYTKTGASSLFNRPFSPEDNMVGPQSVTVQASGGNIDFSKVGGMFLSPDPAGSGKTFLYFTTTNDGVLHHIDWNGTATVPFTVVNLSTGVNWRQQGVAVYTPAGAVAPNQLPHANVQSNCNGLTCTFTSIGSGDPDGTITSYAWNFGDGTTSSAQTPVHTFPGTGTYPVSLTVTDNSGGTNTATQSLSVVKPNAPPVASMTVSCTQRDCSFDGTASGDPDGTIASYAWNFGDGNTATGPTAAHSYTADGSYTATLTVTDNQGAQGTATQPVNVNAIASQVSFIGSDQVNKSGTSWTVHIPNTVAAGDGLLVAASTNSASVPVTGPGAGWSLVKSAANGALGTSVWQRVAVSSDAGAAVTLTTPSSVNLQLTVLAYRGTLTTNPVTAFAETNETVSGTTHTTPTVTVPTDGSWVVSLWSEKSSTTTAINPQAGQTQRVGSCGTGGGHVCDLLTDGGASVNHGTSAGGVSATATAAGSIDTMWTIVLGSAAAGPPNQPPTASFTSNCNLLTCSFDGGGSSDPDGTIASYAWDFGDGSTDTTNTATPSHTYSAEGPYTVTLTVTDNRGGMATSQQTVQAIAPITGISAVGSDKKDASATTWTVHVPSSVRSGDGLVLVGTVNSGTVGFSSPTGLTGWSALNTLSTSSSTTTVWQLVAPTGAAGQAVTVTTPSTMKGNLALLAYRGTNATSPVSIFAASKETVSRTTHTTPTVTVPTDDSWALSIWTDKSSATTMLTPPGDETQRSELCGTAAGHICTLTADNGAPVASGTLVGGETAMADSASVADTMWTLVLGR
jgi:PKD repeat protein